MTKIDKIYEEYKNRDTNKPWPPEAVFKDVEWLIGVINNAMVKISTLNDDGCPCPWENHHKCPSSSCADCMKDYLFENILEEDEK